MLIWGARHEKTGASCSEIKAMAEFRESPLVRQGRLSVVPIGAAQWRAVEERGRP